ncbi:MAG: ATP-binding protein [Butyrivibrio sp.]|nr:ATP-binding protein [Butyrivibrio sp.]
MLEGFNPEKHRVKAIYGENGSGKTAIMTAISIAKKVAFSLNYLNQTETQTLLSEMINKATKSFSIEFEFVNSVRKNLDVYQYGFTLTQNKRKAYEISHEKLSIIKNYTKNKKYSTLVEIENGQIISADLDKENFEELKKNTQNLLSESSLISRYFNREAVYSNLTIGIWHTLFFFSYINVYLEEEDKHEMYMIGNSINLRDIDSDNNTDIENVKNESKKEKQISYMDAKGRDIVYKEDFVIYKKKIDKLSKFLALFKSDLKTIKIDKRDDGDTYRCELILDYGKYSVNREFESTGIKKLIKVYDALVNADEGGISFIDEMDSNLNDVYLCKIIEYFTKYGKGQLCFTTHNLDPMSVLKNNRNSIDFLSGDNKIIPWKVTGNAAPDRYYRNGMIEDMPFNVDAIDFIGMFGE